MTVANFTFCGNQKVIFGNGTIEKLADIIQNFGRRVLIVTGLRSFRRSPHWSSLIAELTRMSVAYYEETIQSEPSPDMIDRIINHYKDKEIALVVAIGGGSVIDAGKAVSAMIRIGDSIVHYLEGIGSKKHRGLKIPFVAVPTTAGTGSEATKNAVISNIGDNGYKKSLRHDNFIPDVALIDPNLTRSCPPDITAACGLDAFTQLIESYTSSKAHPLTDALAYSGLSAMVPHMLTAYDNGDNIAARSAIAYGAYISGLTLANCGLGVVHGIASIIGGWTNIPHGVVCGTLIAEATKVNIAHLITNDVNYPALKKYAKIGSLLSEEKRDDIEFNANQLVQTLTQWVRYLKMPTLLELGLSHTIIDKIAAKTNIKNNPAPLTEKEIKQILTGRINRNA